VKTAAARPAAVKSFEQLGCGFQVIAKPRSGGILRG
jgi:hypothetical protein